VGLGRDWEGGRGMEDVLRRVGNGLIVWHGDFCLMMMMMMMMMMLVGYASGRT